jgi:hypothetical protein
MKLSRRESILVALFAALFLVLVGGGLVLAGLRSLSGLMRENEALAERAAALQRAVDDRAIWEARDAWLNKHTEMFRSREDASAALLGHLETLASEAGMQLTGREILGADPETSDPGMEGETASYFRKATIRVRVQGEPEKVLTWLHGLQDPGRLIGVTGETIDAEDRLVAEIEVTKSYFEGEE